MDYPRASVAVALCLTSCTFGSEGKGSGGQDGSDGSGDATTQASVDDGAGPAGTAPATTGDDATGPVVTATDTSPDPETSDSGSATDTGTDTGETGEWSSKRHITFSAAALALEAEPDVPVLVILDDSTIEYASMAADGSDLRFRDESETTLLPYDIELWDPGGVSLVWVNVPEKPSAPDSDGFWMSYGNPTADSGEDKAAVWSGGQGYLGVWHMDGDPTAAAPQFSDATQSGRDGTAGTALDGSSVVSHATLGPGIAFNGSVDSVIQIPTDAALDLQSGMMVEVVVQLSSLPTDAFRSALRKDAAWTLNSLRQGVLASAYRMWDTVAIGVSVDGPSQDMELHYMVGMYSLDGMGGGTMSFYVDGVAFGPAAQNPPLVTANPVSIGWLLPGTVYEARVSSEPRRARYVEIQNLGFTGELVVIGPAQRP